MASDVAIVVLDQVPGLALGAPTRRVVHLLAVAEGHPPLAARHVGHPSDCVGSATQHTVRIITHVVGT